MLPRPIAHSPLLGLLLASALSLLLAPLAAASVLQPGQRVWLRMDSDNLRDDGYAVGLLLEVTGDSATLRVKEWVEGPGRTLYGSCRTGPGGFQAAVGAAELAAEAATGSEPAIAGVPLALLSDWRSGRHRFLQREQLATIFFRWNGDAEQQSIGLPARRARMAAARAAELGLPRVAAAFALVEADLRAAGADGFPRPAVQQIAAWPAALDGVEAVLVSYPDVALELRPMAADLLWLALERLALRMRARLAELAALEPDLDAALRRWPQLLEVWREHRHWLRLPPLQRGEPSKRAAGLATGAEARRAWAAIDNF